MISAGHDHPPPNRRVIFQEDFPTHLPADWGRSLAAKYARHPANRRQFLAPRFATLTIWSAPSVGPPTRSAV